MRKMMGLILVCCLAVTKGYGQEKKTEGIRFEQGTWAEAVQKAKGEGKPLFVDVWASWCGPCKRLAREVFPQAEVGEYFNEHFVCYSLQTDPADSIARATASQIGDRYQVKALPTLLWLDADGTLLHTSVGYVGAEQLIKAAQQATDSEHNTAAILKRWSQGDRSLATGLVYFEVYRDSLEQFDEFYLSLPREEKLNTELRYTMMFGLRMTPKSRALQYIARHWDDVYRTDSMATDWELFLKNTLEDFFYQAKTEGERDTIAATYPLPYTSACRDMARCKQWLDEGNHDGFFRLLGEMMEKYEDCFFMHALTIDLSYELGDGKLDKATLPDSFVQWIERYIARKGSSDYWSAYYRATAAALAGDVETTRRQCDLLREAVQQSGYDDDYKAYTEKRAEMLSEAASRKAKRN